MITAEQLPNDRIIALDGTSGSGKSTIARALGSKLDLKILESGSLYRATTLLCLEQGIDVHDENRICEVIENMDFKFDTQAFVGERNISEEIRTHEVASNVSYVSVHPRVRELLTQKIRQWIVENEGGVVEGRDITSVVAPNARLRFYVDAPEEIRASRRSIDSTDNMKNRTKDEIQQVIAMRDKIDSSRKSAPLKKLDDVPLIDTSIHELNDIVEKIVESYKTESKFSL